MPWSLLLNVSLAATSPSLRTCFGSGRESRGEERPPGVVPGPAWCSWREQVCSQPSSHQHLTPSRSLPCPGGQCGGLPAPQGRGLCWPLHVQSQVSLGALAQWPEPVAKALSSLSSGGRGWGCGARTVPTSEQLPGHRTLNVSSVGGLLASPSPSRGLSLLSSTALGLASAPGAEPQHCWAPPGRSCPPGPLRTIPTNPS